MAKYYISSGDLQTIIDRPTPLDAAVDAYRNNIDRCEALGTFTMISESGFEEYHDDTMFYPTAEILRLAGVDSQFEPATQV